MSKIPKRHHGRRTTTSKVEKKESQQHIFPPDGPEGVRGQLARKEAKGFKGRIENSPPIGMLPNGKLNVVESGSPKFTPTIITPAK
jgi:hypothetical protein